MSDEMELDLDTQESTEDIISRKDKRLKKLNDDVRAANEEKEALAKAKEEAEAKALQAQKDADFFKTFNTVSSKYQGASEYQDKIREKAALGLDVEEATMLVMAKEGKYTPPTAPVERESAAGGSAATTLRSEGGKTPDQMTQAERRAALEESFNKGEISL